MDENIEKAGTGEIKLAKRNLGKTGLRVTPIGLGVMQFSGGAGVGLAGESTGEFSGHEPGNRQCRNTD